MCDDIVMLDTIHIMIYNNMEKSQPYQVEPSRMPRGGPRCSCVSVYVYIYGQQQYIVLRRINQWMIKLGTICSDEFGESIISMSSKKKILLQSGLATMIMITLTGMIPQVKSGSL